MPLRDLGGAFPSAISSGLRKRGGRQRALMGQLSQQVALLWLAAAVRPDARGDEEAMLLAQPCRHLD